MPKFMVRDTITIERVWEVRADDGCTAIEYVALSFEAIPAGIKLIGHTPREAELVEEE